MPCPGPVHSALLQGHVPAFGRRKVSRINFNLLAAAGGTGRGEAGGRGWWDLLLIMCGILKINKTQCCSDGNEADADVALQQQQRQRQKGQPDKDGHLSAGVGLALLLLLLLLLLA